MSDDVMQSSDEMNPNITWHQGQPYSTHFQDVYFSTDDGLAETRYVFLQGNDLATRFQLANIHPFTIIETGFGTGLNFLCAAQFWLENASEKAVMHFISVEKFPLNLNEITLAQSNWPSLELISHAFLAKYSQLLKGKNSIWLFDQRVQLTLLFDDAYHCLKTLNLKADAWFLDGFTPAKNPDMWSAELFEQVARLSDKNSTFATFSSASMVRRGLLAAGFVVQKRSGFGKKREMLTGYFLSNNP